MMNTTLESYPFLKQRLNNYIFSIPIDVGSTRVTQGLDETLKINNLTLNITITEPLISLVQKACNRIEIAKKTGDHKDIEEAEKALSLIYDSYCYEELAFELNNLKKALQLPDLIAHLDVIKQIHDKNERFAKVSRGIREAVELLKYYPENDSKSELKYYLDELQITLKDSLTFENLNEMVSQLQERVNELEGNISQAESFLNDLYVFRKNYQSVSTILNQSLLNVHEIKELRFTMKEIRQINNALDHKLVTLLNEHIDSSLVPSILRLINEKEFHELIGSIEFESYFVKVNKNKTLNNLSDWKQAITETVGMYFIKHATNYEQLNKGILLFEYEPYINLGKERLEVCEQFYNTYQAELRKYSSIENILADIKPLIDERNNKVQRVNDVESLEEMISTLKELFEDNKKNPDINLISSKYVWLRRMRQPYRNLNQIIKDIETAEQSKLDIELRQLNTLEIDVENTNYRFISKSKKNSDTLCLIQ